ncbi:MAG: hypothetical protein AVDCRST_MAG02-4047, partial [uncultured Rubrobacteraceae bacterium]
DHRDEFRQKSVFLRFGGAANFRTRGRIASVGGERHHLLLL